MKLEYRSKKRKSSKHKPTAIDLFCGCGGLTLGLRKAGFSVIGAVDNDPLAIEIYRANHPDVEIWPKDIGLVKTYSVKRKLGLRKGELELLAGCPPCQGFSTMRTLNGKKIINDPKNDLITEFTRFVRDLMPKAIMLENVPGLGKDARFHDFQEELGRLGYEGESRILNAAMYGVPQRRRRLIYLAGFHKKITFADPSQERKTVRDAIKDLPKAGTSGDPIHDMPELRGRKVVELIRRIPKDGGSRSDLPLEDQLECHKNCNGFKDVYGRMVWDDVAPTITSGCFNPSKGRFLHPEEDRAITMREAALLQGFPIRYKFPTTNKTALALMIGNALPPEFIRRHALRVKKEIKPCKDQGGAYGKESGRRPTV